MIDFTSLPDENTKRFVAVLNKKVDMGRLYNALGHMTAGLVAEVNDLDRLCFLQYRDKEEGIHPSISHYPFIVLKADNSNKIRKVREELLQQNIPFTDFTNTMIVGTSAEQVKATAETSEQDLEYFGICMFGDTTVLKEFTGKFSLFK
ncbi:hypothetical protein AYI98_02035 [Shewanella algae]|uniref:DUF2000 domain-containing protein n=1 Tax=Shewanella algae TaxID=38313 RepID=UPI001182E454|nr:DUF2000 domain-containing protein [Shewanella algae]QTE84220.1 DUF2000 domain-containing protein [Shewanella algae]TVL52936.1 hypothetical protein AYI98_02035 [Shewanella algae]TWO85639.1 hypothetical protein AYI75_00385 [Shewanella algae]